MKQEKPYKLKRFDEATLNSIKNDPKNIVTIDEDKNYQNFEDLTTIHQPNQSSLISRNDFHSELTRLIN